MIAHLIRWRRKLARWREDRRYLAEVTSRRAAMAADLEKMRHWPAPVQARMQEQIDAMDRQIDSVRRHP